MKFEDTKWGVRLIFENGKYIGFAWKAWAIAVVLFVIIKVVAAYVKW